MDEVQILHFLKETPEILRRIDSDSRSEFQIQRELRKNYEDDVVRAALTLRDVRRKAFGKFSRASEMWFDRQGFEQATSEPVARHKAGRFQGTVYDFCCGIGADSIALADRSEVIAVDNQFANCLRAKWNSEVYQVADRIDFVCSDVESLCRRDGLLHIDPDRRQSHRRAVRLEDCVPGLEFLRRMTHEFTGGAIKTSPASNFFDKFPGAEVELISLNGECKEATIWFGQLAGECPYRATVLPSGETIYGNPMEFRTDVGAVGSFVFDPDPAVVRAGLVDKLCEHLQLTRLDDAEEYLTGDKEVTSPFVQTFRVEADLSNNTRDIRRYFRQADFSQVEIKCRHIPIQADAIRRKLPLNGQRPGVLIFAKVGGKSRAIIASRIGAQKKPDGKPSG